MSFFGNLTSAAYYPAGLASSTRALAGGRMAFNNTIDSVEIATTGNATDFGDLTVGRGSAASASNGHGGL
jgi:hypothetical protein